MYKISPLGRSAAIITPNGNKNLNSYSIEKIKEIFAQHGVLLFRGFDIDLQAYSNFVHSLCRKITLDPARQFVSNTAQLVDSGYDSIPLHCENGLTPFLPDLLAFMCEIPASKGSETTYCDGQLVWEKLSTEAKQYFTAHNFHFTRVIPKELWKRYLANELGVDMDKITPQVFQQVSSALPQHHFELQENENILADISVKLVHPSRFSTKPSFANSLIGPSYNYQKPIAQDEEGHAIPQKFVDEFEKISDELTEDVLWQEHDMLIIDNTRYMHGRRKIEDTHRKIYASMGYM